MVDFSRSMIDPLQDRQFKTVFAKFDKDNIETLDWSQFQEFCYAIGLQFLITDYEDDLRTNVFDGNLEMNRASYDDFKEYIDMKTKYEEGPERYEADMSIFDEDHNGEANIEDVKRVMKDIGGMSDQDISLFVKKCVFPNLTEEQRNQSLDQLNLPETFNIRKSAAHLYNI